MDDLTATEATEQTPTDAPGTEPADVAGDHQPQPGSAPEDGTSANDRPEPAFEAPFRLEDVPEEYRPHVELYTKQLHGAFTRKTQELAAQRQQVAELVDLAERLGTDETRDEALANLLERYGYELAGEDDPEAEEVDLPTGEDDDPVLARIEALQRQLEERDAADEAAREQAAQEAFNERVLGSVEEAFGKFAKQEGIEQLPDSTRRAILTLAASMPRLPDGMPDMDSAIATYEADRAADIQRYLKSKDVVVPELGSSSGQPTFDPRDERARLKAANAVAERALARHA